MELKNVLICDDPEVDHYELSRFPKVSFNLNFDYIGRVHGARSKDGKFFADIEIIEAKAITKDFDFENAEILYGYRDIKEDGKLIRKIYNIGFWNEKLHKKEEEKQELPPPPSNEELEKNRKELIKQLEELLDSGKVPHRSDNRKSNTSRLLYGPTKTN